MPPVTLVSVRIPTPIGELVAFVDHGAVCALDFADGGRDPLRDLEKRFGRFAVREEPDALGLRRCFEAYRGGDLRALDDIPVDPGGTAFQRKVWAALRKIPAGKTASYAEVARRVGAPRAVRAVGAANGRNPVAIVIPCHRVVCSDGSLGGYGGGLERKRWLLAHEQASLPGLGPEPAQRPLFGG